MQFKILAPLYIIQCNPCLYEKMMNCSDTIDINLSYQIYRTLVRSEYSKKLKMIFSCNFNDIGYVKFLITLLLYI